MAAGSGVAPKPLVHSTAGAITIRNEKGEISMEKVKVARYVTGKRPDYAPDDDSDDSDDGEYGFIRPRQTKTGITTIGPVTDGGLPTARTDAERDDRRLRRLQERQNEDDEEDNHVEIRRARHRRLHEPEVLGRDSDEEEGEEEVEKLMDADDSGEEEELDEEEIERRRNLLKSRARSQREEEELMDKEDERSEEGSEAESSDYEEYTDSEDDEMGTRLKPVFVRKRDRVTIQEKEREALRQRHLEHQAKQAAEERRRYTLKMVADEAKKDFEEEQGLQNAMDGTNTDDENDEEEYEAWKVRELKRLKRDREEREVIQKEKDELERLHNMTEEERRLELKNKPKQITNKKAKGKYKFLQKYYHRGAFFMDKEDEVFTQDFSGATLEDHFDKTILPKVMQVKNFGRSGRTKYTHLVDQDSTQFDSPWSDPQMSTKMLSKAGGLKQVFDRPSAKKRK